MRLILIELRLLGLIALLLITSCVNTDEDYGATIGDCDDICTVYHVAQKELMKDYEIFDRNFPDKELRRNHVKKTSKGYHIKSWFYTISENNDTSYTYFSCAVYLETTNKIEYVVENLMGSNTPY